MTKTHIYVYMSSGAKDILTSEGFLRWIWAAMNIKEGGLLVAGILCSTWSVVNRHLARKWGIDLMKSIPFFNLCIVDS